MPRFQNIPPCIHGAILALCSTFAILPVWAHDAIKITNIHANPQNNQIILDLSAPAQAKWVAPYTGEGEHRFLVDIPDSTLGDLKDKDSLLQSISTDLPDITEVTLDEFRGPAPLVRLMIKTQNPQLMGSLLQKSGNRVVLQFSDSAKPATALEPKPLQTASAKPHGKPTQSSARETPGNSTGVDSHHSAAAREKQPVATRQTSQSPAVRPELLNTLSKPSVGDLNQLLDAEKSFREGKHLEFEGDTQQAEEHYKNALQLSPQVQEYALALSALYMKQKMYANAKTTLESSLQYHPLDSDLLNELGKVSLLMKNETAALGYFKKAIPVGVLSNYGSTLRRLGHIEEAKSIYQLALSISPNDSDLQYNLGNLYLNQKRYAEAQALFAQCVKLTPDFAEAHFHLGLAHAGLGNSKQALEELKTYLKLMPDAPNKTSVSDYIQNLEKVGVSTP